MTLKEIAEIAGVSPATVSKVLNHKDKNINADTRKKILSVIKEYNYYPYNTVRTPADSVSFLLAVVLSSTEGKGSLTAGILHSAQSQGYSTIVFDSCNSMQEELKCMDLAVRRGVNGIIWEPVSDENVTSCIDKLKEYKIPYILIGRHISEKHNRIRIDYSKLSATVTKYLIAERHSEIGLILPEKPMKEYLLGYKIGLFENGINFNEDYIFHIEDPLLPVKIFNSECTALICCDYASASKLYMELKTNKRSIPDDYSIAAVMDGEKENPDGISCIRIDYSDFGRVLVEKLIAAIENSQPIADFSYCPDHLDVSGSTVSAPSHMKKNNIIVVGSINIDLISTVDFLPQSGNTSRISKYDYFLGGKGANQAIGVKKLGNEVSLISKIGKDTDSAYALHELKEYSVSDKYVGIENDVKTGHAYIFIDNREGSCISIHSGANSHLTKDDIVKRSSIFHYSKACLISTEIPISACLAAATLARENHLLIVVKPSAQHSIPDEMYSLIDIFLPNEQEASALCPDCKNIEAQADYFLRKGVSAVVITRGSRDFLYQDKDIRKYYHTESVGKVTDATGGADAFISALTSYLISGCSMDASLRIAAYAAAFCVAERGVSPALVNKETLENYILKHEPGLLQCRISDHPAT